MRQWLDVCMTEGGLLVAQQKLHKRPLLVRFTIVFFNVKSIDVLRKWFCVNERVKPNSYENN